MQTPPRRRPHASSCSPPPARHRRGDAIFMDEGIVAATSSARLASPTGRFTSMRPPSLEQATALAAGLTLCGAPLAPPRMYPVPWRVGQVFSPGDDPDRTQEPWNPPSFVQRNPAKQHANMSVEELDLPGFGSEGETFARVVHGVLDPEDCAELITAVNAKGFTPALLNKGGGRQQLRPDYRDGFRVIVDSEPLAKWLLEVLRPYLPEKMPDRGFKLDLEALNERCRFLCYTPGQRFEEHRDGRLVHPCTGAVSRVTVQLYLHDVPLTNGGATTFLFDCLSDDVSACSDRGFDFERKTLACQPRGGSVLIFSQDLLHEGSLVEGGLKYTFRTEAMYKLGS